MTSPARTPAAAAGEPGSTPTTVVEFPSPPASSTPRYPARAPAAMVGLAIVVVCAVRTVR